MSPLSLGNLPNKKYSIIFFSWYFLRTSPSVATRVLFILYREFANSHLHPSSLLAPHSQDFRVVHGIGVLKTATSGTSSATSLTRWPQTSHPVSPGPAFLSLQWGCFSSCVRSLRTKQDELSWFYSASPGRWRVQDALTLVSHFLPVLQVSEQRIKEMNWLVEKTAHLAGTRKKLWVLYLSMLLSRPPGITVQRKVNKPSSTLRETIQWEEGQFLEVWR